MSELTIKRRRSGAISGAERITGVKNAQADMLLSRKKLHFDVLFKKKEQDIQLEEHKLENETKLLNLENKRNELEYKRRLYPASDLSHEVMTVANLEKYLVRNANKLCYTDKSLENKVRINCSTDTIPPIVAEARLTIVRKEIIKAVEKNRKHMYNFLDKPVSRQNKLPQHHVQGLDEMDRFEEVIKENKFPGFSGHLMPELQNQQSKESPHSNDSSQPHHKKQQFLELPMVHEQPIVKRVSNQKEEPVVKAVKIPFKEMERQELHRKLKENPVIREAMDSHQKERHLHDHSKPSQSVATVLSRMVKKKPPTKTQIQEEQENVRCQVGEFCERIDKLLWDYKEEQFKQDIKFVKDKDTAWNKFMETMKKRSRTNNLGDSDSEEFVPELSYRRRPTTTGIPTTPLPDKERERMLMKNLLIDSPRLVESAPTRKRGVPHHTEKRSQHHSPRAKLHRMLEKNKNILDAVIKAGQEKQQEPSTAGLVAATKQAQVAAK